MAIVERLEFDVSSAEDAISKLDDSLSTAVQSFKVNLADALDVLSAVQVEVAPPDTTPITESIDTAIAAADDTVQLTFPFDGAAEITQPIDAAIAAADTSVQVDADTSQAEEAISALGRAAEESSGGVENLHQSVEGFGAAAGVAEGSARELTSFLGGLSEEAGIAAAAILTVSAATGGLFEEGLKAASAEERFNRTLGDQAEAVKKIQVGSFTADLDQLAVSMGATNAQIENTVSTLTQFATNSGASSVESRKFTDEILALAARAEALNPALGNVSDIANTLAIRIARGGRFAAQFGIQLSTAQISAEALKETGKDTASALTIYEKAAAAATLATQKYGDSIKADVEAGSQNAAIQLESLKATFSDTLEEIGKPLVVPVLGLLKDALPIAKEFAQGFADIGKEAVPLVTDALEKFGPVLAIAAASLQLIAPVLGVVDDLINAIPEPLIVAAAAIGTFILAGDALEALLLFLPGLFTAAGDAAIASGEAIAATNPILLVVGAAVGILAANWFEGEQRAQELKHEVEGLTTSLKDQDGQVRITTDGVDKYLATQTAIGKDQAIVELLNQTGLSFQQLADLSQHGVDGVDKLATSLVKAGKLTPVTQVTVDSVKLADGSIRNLNETVQIGSQRFLTVGGSTKKLVDSFKDLATSVQETAHNTLDAAIANKQLDKSQVDGLENVTKLSSGNADYVAVLAKLQPTIDKAVEKEKARQDALDASATAQKNATTAAEEARTKLDAYQNELSTLLQTQPQVAQAFSNTTAATSDTVGALTNLAIAVGNANLSDDKVKGIAEGLGISADQLKVFIDGVNKALDDLTTSAVSKIPTVQGSIDSLVQTAQQLKVAFNPDDIAPAIDKNIKNIEDFSSNLDTFVSSDLPHVAKLAAENGPDFAQALADKIKANPAFAQELEAKLTESDQVTLRFIAHFKNDLAPQIIEQLGETGALASQAFGANLTFPDITQLLKDAATAGQRIAGSFIDGAVNGFSDDGRLTHQATVAADNATQAVKDAWHTTSPSKVAIGLGQNFMAGLRIGFTDEGASVVAEAERITKAAIAAVQSQATAPLTTVTAASTVLTQATRPAALTTAANVQSGTAVVGGSGTTLIIEKGAIDARGVSAPEVFDQLASRSRRELARKLPPSRT